MGITITPAAEPITVAATNSHHHRIERPLCGAQLRVGRISLGLSPEMKQHQMENMRSHMAAIQSIVGHLANNEFGQAAQVAHSKLGLTEEMKKMCSTMSGNENFGKLGMAFHQSGDQLGDVLQGKDMKKSLQALQATMDYCVQCHSTFRR